MLVGDLTRTRSLRLDLRVVGDLDRPVRWVHTVEVPDPARFLRGGEVVLTTGLWRDAGVAPEEFVADLVRAGVAALGFGLVPPERTVPPGLVEAAARHGLTCFVVPAEVAFVQVVEDFVAAKRCEWERPLRRHLDRYEAFVSALRSGRGVEPVLRVLSRQTGWEVAVRADGVVHGVAPQPSYAVPLVGEGPAGAEVLLPVPWADCDPETQAAVAGAGPFLALEVERARAIRATDLRYAAELVDWVLAGTVDPAVVRTRLTALGVPSDGALLPVVVRGGAARQVADALGPCGLAVQRDDGVVALVAGGDAEAVGARVAAVGDVAVGVGPSGSVEDLRLGLLHAGHAADALVARGTVGWLTHRRLSSPTLLLDGQDPALLEATATAVLGPVLDSDDRRGSELLDSLRVFLDCGGRWQEAAAELHVHLNTLRHRMKRVEELTGLSLGSTQDRVDLFLALRSLART